MENNNDFESDSGVTAWDMDQLYDKVVDIIVDFEEEQKLTANKFENITMQLDDMTHAINCYRQMQVSEEEINNYLAKQSIYRSRNLLASVAIGLCVGTLASTLFFTKKY
jgi:hypothetical protein